ncbi:MAG: PilW family protein [Parashewanella sp.]
MTVKVGLIHLHHGFSLVELMVALVISLFLTLGLFTMLRMSVTNVTTTSQFNQLQENGRIALSILERDISQTGFWGDTTKQSLIIGSNASVISPTMSTANDCIGEGTNNASYPKTGSIPFRALWGYSNGSSITGITCLSSVDIDTDVLQLKRLSNLTTTAPNVANRHYVATTASQATFFMGSQAAPNLPNVRYWEYKHHVYYIRTQDGVPSLRRRRLVGLNMLGNGGGDEQLVEGIEQMRFLYGVDNNGDSRVDSFISANNVPEVIWDGSQSKRIIALQVFILVRAIEPDRNYTNNIVYKLGGLTIAAKNDHYRRKVMMTTVSLENLVANQ